MRLLIAAGLGTLAVLVWRRIGFIRMETPLSEQKRQSSIFEPTTPRYRQTQRAKLRSLRDWQRRYDAERRRA